VSILRGKELWGKGLKGQGVKVGIFDTGLQLDHPHFKHVRRRTNWTHEDTFDDTMGHGSHVAGCIASADAGCPGLAPEADIFTFKVFTNDQVSYTSWYLDAFNYAMAIKIHVLNLSIGGPDFDDVCFVDKAREISANGIILVAAIGNDGPRYGTLNNPGDNMDVLGIGAVDYSNRLSSFSSRGMSVQEVPGGYGRPKPDIVTYGSGVLGSRLRGGCRRLSGTSVAAPVATGAVALLASTVPAARRWSLLNPGSIKQVLVEGATKVANGVVYESGAGVLDLQASATLLRDYAPRASLFPPELDLTTPYMWPHSMSPVYATKIPHVFNATIINGMGVLGAVEAPPVWAPDNEGGRHLTLDFSYGPVWPYSGYLGVHISVKDAAKGFAGVASGSFRFTVVSPPMGDETAERRSTVTVPLKVQIVPTPPREKRVLWDQFRSIAYPPAYIPSDNPGDQLDLFGDHPHTNFRSIFRDLRSNGYHLEVLGSPATCFDASQYGALLIVDPEEEFLESELEKLHRDVTEGGLHLVVVSEWYDFRSGEEGRFYDDNTRTYWSPATGGANVPALNELLGKFGIELDGVFVANDRVDFPPGSGLVSALAVQKAGRVAKFPAGGYLHLSRSQNGLLGLLKAGKGMVSVVTDTFSLDDATKNRERAPQLIRSLIEAGFRGEEKGLTSSARKLQSPFVAKGATTAVRMPDVNFAEISKVKGKSPVCGCGSAPAFRAAELGCFPTVTAAATLPAGGAAAAAEPAGGAAGGAAAAAGRPPAEAAAAGPGLEDGPLESTAAQPQSARVVEAERGGDAVEDTQTDPEAFLHVPSGTVDGGRDDYLHNRQVSAVLAIGSACGVGLLWRTRFNKARRRQRAQGSSRGLRSRLPY